MRLSGQGSGETLGEVEGVENNMIKIFCVKKIK